MFRTSSVSVTIADFTTSISCSRSARGAGVLGRFGRRIIFGSSLTAHSVSKRRLLPSSQNELPIPCLRSHNPSTDQFDPQKALACDPGYSLPTPRKVGGMSGRHSPTYKSLVDPTVLCLRKGGVFVFARRLSDISYCGKDASENQTWSSHRPGRWRYWFYDCNLLRAPSCIPYIGVLFYRTALEVLLRDRHYTLSSPFCSCQLNQKRVIELVLALGVAVVIDDHSRL